MTLDQLRYFVAAAKYEHIHRAAQSIPISASVISQSIKLLEEELNCELFTREKKTVRLTNHGTRLLELSTELLGKVDGIKEELNHTVAPLSGHYRLGASHFLAAKLLTPAWTSMQMDFPKLTVDMHSQATWILVDSIIAGRIDFGVGFSPMPHPQLDYEEIYSGYSEVVVRKNHPIFAKGDKPSYKLLSDYPATMHMFTEKIFSARQYPVLKELNLDRTINFGFDSDFTAIENLRGSNNWSFMIDIIAAEFGQYIRKVPTPQKTDNRYTIQLIKHKSRKMDAVMIEAYERIKQYAQKMKQLK